MTVETGYLLTLSLSVENASSLWEAAAALAMTAPGMTMDDVVDTIGPRTMPSIDDCLTLLLQPERFAGCALHSIDIMRPGATPTAMTKTPRLAPTIRHDDQHRSFDIRRGPHPAATLAALKAAARLD
ncbi:MAG TPA: hypothetical protein VM900_04265 [Sphingomonas sp.]|jgi:hypothetical protein|nr:hypothetical protein [Sphingomonas sp.]